MIGPLLNWAVFRITISKFELLAIINGFNGVAVFVVPIDKDFKNDGACVRDIRVVQLGLNHGQNVCNLSVMGRIKTVFVWSLFNFLNWFGKQFRD